MRCEYLVAVMVVWLISGLADARAQDSVTSPEIEQLERKLRTLELESQINAEKLKSWPSATVSAPSDSVTVENASYFPSVLAFRSLNAIAGGIADELEEAKETTDSEQKDKLIFLEWEDIFLQEALYDVTKSNLGEIQTGLDGVHRICKDTKEDGENCLKDPGKCEEAARKADAVESLMGPIIPIIPGLVGFAAQLRSFFNVERTIKGVVFKVESSALEAMLIENLSPNWEVLLPEISKTAGSEMLKALIGSIESAGKLETCRVDLLVQV